MLVDPGRRVGRLGRKTGNGFHRWVEGVKEPG
jgi:hypothetical protein